MAFIGLQKGSGKRSRFREKSVKSQGILKWIMSGNPDMVKTFENLPLQNWMSYDLETWHVASGTQALQSLYKW